MCMKNYNDEKIIFDKFSPFFNIAIFLPLLIYNRGQRVSFARVMGLFKPIHRMFAIVLKVHTL